MERIEEIEIKKYPNNLRIEISDNDYKFGIFDINDYNYMTQKEIYNYIINYIKDYDDKILFKKGIKTELKEQIRFYKSQ